MKSCLLWFASLSESSACDCRWASAVTCDPDSDDGTHCWSHCCDSVEDTDSCKCGWANNNTCDPHANDDSPCWSECCHQHHNHHHEDQCRCGWANNNTCDPHANDDSPCWSECCHQHHNHHHHEDQCNCGWANGDTCVEKANDNTPCWAECCGHPECRCEWANEHTCDVHANDGTPCWKRCCGDHPHNEKCACGWTKDEKACYGEANDGSPCWSECCPEKEHPNRTCEWANRTTCNAEAQERTGHFENWKACCGVPQCDCSWKNDVSCAKHANDGTMCWQECCSGDDDDNDDGDGSKIVASPLILADDDDNDDGDGSNNCECSWTKDEKACYGEANDGKPCWAECCYKDKKPDPSCAWANRSTCNTAKYKKDGNFTDFKKCCGKPLCECNWKNEQSCEKIANDGSICWQECCKGDDDDDDDGDGSKIVASLVSVSEDPVILADNCSCNWAKDEKACYGEANDGNPCWSECCYKDKGKKPDPSCAWANRSTCHTAKYKKDGNFTDFKKCCGKPLCECNWKNEKSCKKVANDGSICWQECCKEEEEEDGRRRRASKKAKKKAKCAHLSNRTSCEAEKNKKNGDFKGYKECCGDPHCDCHWKTANSCHKHSNDGTICWQDCCNPGDGRRRRTSVILADSIGLAETSSNISWMPLAVVGVVGISAALLLFKRRQQNSSLQEQLLHDVA